jgi:hypothetical protein
MTVKAALATALIISVLATIASQYGYDLPSPPDWLRGWLSVLVTMVGVLVGKKLAQDWIAATRASRNSDSPGSTR